MIVSPALYQFLQFKRQWEERSPIREAPIKEAFCGTVPIGRPLPQHRAAPIRRRDRAAGSCLLVQIENSRIYPQIYYELCRRLLYFPSSISTMHIYWCAYARVRSGRPLLTHTAVTMNILGCCSGSLAPTLCFRRLWTMCCRRCWRDSPLSSETIFNFFSHEALH